MSTVIGRFFDTNEPAVIGDMERRAGVYVLGRSGMGKSSLLVRMMGTDVKSAHSVFFLDPHGDAIEDFKNRCDLAGRIDDIILLDPEREETSFAINLLSCKDVNSSKERQDTYNRAYKVFHDLWQKEKEFGVWLQSSLRHTINAFIETPGLTLAEVPRFLTNSAVRSELVANMKHEWVSAEFWRGGFAAKRESDQEAYLRPLLKRVNELLAHRFVRHIVGQADTTIDFSKLIGRSALF